MLLSEAKEILEKNGYLLENDFSSGLALKKLDVKDGDLYATFDIVETEDSESFIKYYNIFPGDEFTSKVRFSDKGEPYVTGLNRANYRWYFNPEDSQKIRTAARSLRR